MPREARVLHDLELVDFTATRRARVRTGEVVEVVDRDGSEVIVRVVSQGQPVEAWVPRSLLQEPARGPVTRRGAW